MNSLTSQFRKNISLVGPPGSGKGSYGRLLARSLGMPLITVSDVLRQTLPEAVLASGQLVGDDLVSELLLQSISTFQSSSAENANRGYMLDGFPRTLQQVHLMEETWPSKNVVQAVISLDVPDRICEEKLLGRRICTKCGGNFNVASVLDDKWDLPPTLPNKKKDKIICKKNRCKFYPDWKTREDDQPDIVQERLKLHHDHIDPILDYFDSNGRLFKFRPYKGYDDLPEFEETLRRWLIDMEENEKNFDSTKEVDESNQMESLSR